MRKGLFVTLFTLSVSTLYAQTDFRPGYVITNSYDTIYGQIDYRGDKLMGQVCKFKSAENHITEYSPEDIIAYRFTDGKYYISKEIADKFVFLEFLIKGQVNIYYVRDKRGDHYYIDKGNMSIVEIPYEEKIILVNKKEKRHVSKKHVGMLNYYMQDVPEIQPQIAKIKKPGHNDLIKLADNYHHKVCKDGENCIIFEKRPPSIKVSLNLTAGLVTYRNLNQSFQGGATLNFWMPRTNEKIYFRTGLLYSKLEDNMMGYTWSVYKIPIMFEYMYSKFMIKPKVAYGVCLYQLSGSNNEDIFAKFAGNASASFVGGLNIGLSESISWLFEYHADFESAALLLIPRHLASQAFMTGLSITF